MSVTEVGTPNAPAVSSGTNTPSASPAWAASQPCTTGDYLVCAVTNWGGTTGGTPPTPSGWTQILTVTGSSRSVVTFFGKYAAGGDAAPAISATNTGTSTFSTLAAQLHEFSGMDATTAVGASGTATGTTANPLVITTSGNVPASGCFALSASVIALSAQSTSTLGAGTGWTDVADNGSTSTRAHYLFGSQASPASGSTLSESVSYTTTGSFLAGAIIVIQVPAGAATLSGSGTLTASPQLGVTATLSGSGTLGSGGTATLSGSGTLGAATIQSLVVALSGSGTLTGRTNVPYLAGAEPDPAGSATCTATAAVATRTGDGLVVIGAANSNASANSPSTCADSKGNLYSLVTSGGTGRATSMYVCANPTPLAVGDTVTVTFAASTQAKNVLIIAVPGMLASPIDQTPAATNSTSTSPSITSGTLATSTETVIAAISSASAGGDPAWGGNFTKIASTTEASSIWTSASYLIPSSTAAVTAPVTLGSSVLWTELMATFKTSGGVPVPGTVVQSAAGAPASSGFTVVTKLNGATSVRLAYSTASNMASPSFVAAQSPDPLGYVRHTTFGLAAKTRYYYQLADTPPGGIETLVGPVGQVKTLPASGSAQNFTVALVSCITQAAADPTAMDDWVAYDADLNVFTGDLDYSGTVSTDTPTQVGIFETQIGGSGTSSTAAAAAGYPSALARMTGQRWGFYCRSDHEAGPDNGDSNNTYTATNIAAAQQVLPFGTLGDQVNSPPRGLYQSWVCGRVRFIMIDIRNLDRSPGANTDDGSKTMLGSQQLTWLQGQLTQSEPLKVIISDVAWMGTPTTINGPDKWWSYSTERQAIINYIAANAPAVGGVMLWHGDTHLVGCTPGTANPYGNFSVYCAAPMHNVGGGLMTSTFTQKYNNSSGNCRQYGRISFTDTGTKITVAFQGWDAVNAVAQVAQTDVFETPAMLSGLGTLGAMTPVFGSAGLSGNGTLAVTPAVASGPPFQVTAGNLILRWDTTPASGARWREQDTPGRWTLTGG